MTGRALFDETVHRPLPQSWEPPPEVRPLSDIDLRFGPTDSILEIFDRASNPSDAFELRDLYLGRVEARLGSAGIRPDLADRWRGSVKRRSTTPADVLGSMSAIGMIKETFNFYFRDDLYGSLRDANHLVLSSGAVDEEEWGLPETLKDCVRYALDSDWYGYSDSRGREPAREAIASYEAARLGGGLYDASNVSITFGGTFSISQIADFVLTHRRATSPALCGIPNYPPLLASIARRSTVQMIETPLVAGTTSLKPLIQALTPQTPLVLIQTVTNPTGTRIVEEQLEELIQAAEPSTIIVLDECHEWLGPSSNCSMARTASNVVRVSSLSKGWSAPGAKVGWILASSDFIDEFYEFASSSFGGPASIFYTVVEVLARFERWRLAGLVEVGVQHLAEFEASYGLSHRSLQAAYTSYVTERENRENALTSQRAVTLDRLNVPGVAVAAARYSINAAVVLRNHPDSYLAFRELLNRSGISVFPGLLTCCFTDGLVRVTTGRRGAELSIATEGLRQFASESRKAAHD